MLNERFLRDPCAGSFNPDRAGGKIAYLASTLRLAVELERFFFLECSAYGS